MASLKDTQRFLLVLVGARAECPHCEHSEALLGSLRATAAFRIGTHVVRLGRVPGEPAATEGEPTPRDFGIRGRSLLPMLLLVDANDWTVRRAWPGCLERLDTQSWRERIAAAIPEIAP